MMPQVCIRPLLCALQNSSTLNQEFIKLSLNYLCICSIRVDWKLFEDKN